jgi:hypothetical protein
MFGRKKKIKLCQHRFKDIGYFVLDGKHPRMFSVCRKCNIAVHRPIYTRKQLEEFEENQLMEGENESNF